MKRDNVREKAVLDLTERMLQGEVTFYLAYYAPEDIYCRERMSRRVRGTLVGYESDMGKPFRHRRGCQFVPYWDVELQEWRTFRVCNLMTDDERME